MAPPLPCLKEHNWAGRDQTVCRPLWPKESPHMPWLAIGYDHPHTFEFISQQRLAEMSTTAAALEAQALDNLRQRPATWQPIDAPVPGAHKLQMLLCIDDFFAAERIIDPAFMQLAHGTLNAPFLLAGIPRRGMMVVTRGDQDAKMIRGFGAVIAGQFTRGESPPITPMLFIVRDGAISETVGFEGDLPAEETTENANASYISALTTRNDDGTEDVQLMAGGESGEQLAKDIESAFMGVLQEHAQRKEFSGHIRIVVLAMLPRSERKHLPALIEHLRGICAESSKDERQFRVSLTYQREGDGQSANREEAAHPEGLFGRLKLFAKRALSR